MAEPKAAASGLAKLLTTEGAPSVFRLDLARAQMAVGRPSAAQADAERYVKSQPDDAEGHLVLAQVFVMRGKDQPARLAFMKVIELSPGHPRATAGLAKLLAETEPGAALQVLSQALGVYPNNPDLRFALADAQIREEAFEDATLTLTGILELPVRKSVVHTRLAEVWRMRRDYRAAATSASAALADETITDDLRARALRTQAFTKQKLGDLSGARADFRTALKFAPDWAQLHAEFAFVLALDDDLEGAEKCVEHALSLDKKLTHAHLTYGIVLYLAGKTKKAKKELGLVLKEDKESVPANRYLGYVLLEEGKPKTALKHFQRVAEALPDDADSMRMGGRSYLAMGKVDEALESFRSAIDRDPKDGFAHFDLGKALERKEEWDEAEAAYRQAIAVEDGLTHPHLYLAELLDQVQGEPEASLEHYKRYLELGGPDEGDVVAKRIEQLEEKK